MKYHDWIGRTEAHEDTIGAWPLKALAATLGSAAPDGEVPPLWHWLYFLQAHPRAELGPDGHARRGAFLPPVDLPRRMWAGGRFEFHDALRVGDAARRISRIGDIREKQGRTGPLVFVVVRHEIHTQRGLAITEDHDIVYRGHPQPGESPAPQPAPADEAWSATVHPDDVLLFRYSALTFNGHRIHYDRRYCVEVEHYPGLVVHGPLLATLLMELARERRGGTVKRFEFRAVSPVFDDGPFRVCGSPTPGGARLWAATGGGSLAMTANAAFTA